MKSPSARPSGAGASMAFLLAALGRSSTAHLMRFAEGAAGEALEEAGELLESPEGAGPGNAPGGAARTFFRRDLGSAAVHESWFLEPLGAVPADLLPAILALYPPRLMRYVAGLAEENLGASFGKITLDDTAAPAARLLACSFLPPPAPADEAAGVPAGLRSDPLEHLARRPFIVEEEPRDPLAAGIMRDGGAGLEAAAADAMGDDHLPGVGSSLASLALALARHPEAAARLALSMPRGAGRIFLLLSRTLGLAARDETVERYYGRLVEWEEGAEPP